VLHAASGTSQKPDKEELRAAIASELVEYLAERPKTEAIADPMVGLDERIGPSARAVPTPGRPLGTLITFRPRRET